MKAKSCAILLRLPEAIVDRLDEAAYTLRISRSALIRKILVMGLESLEQHELPILEDPASHRTISG